ncbi:hypothetical protein L484_010650 [Morus notabilis]|uniref:Uncharacterized protein n=1 Tax=Morus notabilis TaxID=981085 RepID=W9RPQ8_9ROSA|nr:hypothetical protein L484_010650 [Morus notabilis]
MEIRTKEKLEQWRIRGLLICSLQRVPVIHLFDARFKEHEGNVTGARSALVQCDAELDVNFVANIVLKANMEKRLGNFVAASNIFEEALAMAAEKKKLHTLRIIYVHFSRLKHMIDGADAARDVLIDGIKRLPDCMLLLEELINFAIANGGQRHIHVVDCVINNAISLGSDASQCLNAKDAEDVSRLYIEFVDLCGTIHDVRKAWNRHIRLFPRSVRPAFHKKPTTNMIVTKHQQSSRDCNPDDLVKLPFEDKKTLLLENYDSRSGQDSANHISDQKVPARKTDDIQFEQALTNQFQSGEADSDARKREISPSFEVPEQLRKDMPETNVSSIRLVDSEASEEPREDTTKYQVAEGTESEQALKELSSGDELKQDYDHEPEQYMKTLSLDSLSLHPRDNSSVDLNPSVSSACEIPQDASNVEENMLESNQHNGDEGSLTYNEKKTNTFDSPRTETEEVNFSSSRSHRSPISTEPPHQPCMPANSSGNWHQMNNTGKFRRESKFGSQAHLQRRSYQHQRRVSPQQHPRAEWGGPMSKSQGYPSQVASPHSPQIQQGSQGQHQYQAPPDNVTPPPPSTWPLQNMQQPNYAASPQTIQSSGDHGMQNSQAYNQMWQYYYYQQQLFQQQQQLQSPQQQQQLQSPQQQQQHLHLYQQYQQQQQLQQHYYSHPQPYQQLQLQQQQYNQQHYPPQEQLYQQPQQQQQFYQLPQQQQLQQQQQHQLYMQQVVQQQPPPPPPQQQQIEQKQHQQQNSQSQVQELHGTYYQQDQEIPPSDAREPGLSAASL